jgi:5'-nucleotidase
MKRILFMAFLLLTILVLVVPAALAGPGTNNGKGAENSREVKLQIIAINDFHGNIATTSSSFGGVGRADFLAANIAAAEAEAEAEGSNTIFVSAGDLIGASPLISALFHDEPTIEAMNLLGLDINAVGNHEFDEGPEELLRMQYGGSHPVDGDLDGDPFLGADFQFLAANVTVDATGETIFPAYTIHNYQGVRVAFIGMTLEGTPTIVTPSGVAGLTFHDEAETVNALVPKLQQRNIEAIVVLIHEGGSSDGGPQDCGTGLSGPIAEIVPQLDDAVDLVIAGHTNDEFVCEIDGKWVTMADWSGRLFTDIDVTLNRVTKDMTVVSIENKFNLQAGVTPDPDVTALIDKYDALSAPLANQVIGTITADILRANNSAGESALGDVIADAQLDATDDAGFGDAVVAFMNPGGIRDDMIFNEISGGEAPGEVTFGEAFSVQPFGNSLVTMTLTGAQIDELLEQQFDNPGAGSNRILQVSEGFSYTWDAAQPTGSKVDPATIMINGVPVNPGTGYRVTVNSFLADGGDNFTVLRDGTDRLGGEVDLDALVTYFGNSSPVAPGSQDRISRVN